MATAEHPPAGRAPGRVSPESIDRLPPQNLEAEKGVLGSLLLDSRMCDEVALILQADDFYADANRKLFGHLMAMHEEGSQLDAVLLKERLTREGDLEAIGGAAYLAEVAQSAPYAANAVYYANIVRDKATQRALIHASTEILRDAYDSTLDPTELVSRSEEKIFAVHDQRSPSQVTSIHDLMIEAFDRIDARLEGKEGMGIPTGFTDLDNLTGGLHDSELAILAARPSMGKTALATNIAEYVTIKSGLSTLFVSLEMARLELAQRMLCSQGRIDASKFRRLLLSGKDREDLVRASAKFSKAPLFVDDTASRTLTEIAACARRLKRKEDLRLVVIDYLQLIQPDDPRDPRQEQVAKMARRLKGLARELKIPVLCLAQLNRQADPGRESFRSKPESEGELSQQFSSRHLPRLSQLRESGAIEQDADVVMFIHREEVYYTREEARDRGLAGRAQLSVAKQRNGPTGIVQLAWFDKHTRFEDFSEKHYDEHAPHEDDEVSFP
ncbi:MAG: replicative DNA helicase [Planctomycetota bacterium]|jgi:replicative DNA helicase